MTDTTDIPALMADVERRVTAAALLAQGVGDSAEAEANAAFIAAANPAAILALLAHARAETARADAAESDRNGMQRRLAQARKEVDEADEAIEALERDRAADKARIAKLVEALRPFAKAGELFRPHESNDFNASIYRPAADEYALCSNDLRRAALAVTVAAQATSG